MDTKLYILVLAAITTASCHTPLLPNNDQVLVVEESVDQEPCVCSDDLRPVCGSDGNTYSNKCHMKCAGKDLTIDNEGYCETNPKVVKVPSVRTPCSCVRSHKPVCGSDGVTYDNECLLKCAGEDLTVKNHGPCEESIKIADLPTNHCTCVRSYKPVCGSDGQTYANDCLLNCVKDVTVKNVGPCEESSSLPPCACTRNFKPVCGSDGKTYSNDCVMRCVDADLSVAHKGKCESDVVVKLEPEQAPPCVCTRNLKPVCSIDGVTYNNECLLRCAGKDMKSEGPCDPLLRD